MTDKHGGRAAASSRPRSNEIIVSFVNMLPEEKLVAAVKQVAWLHDFRLVASSLERIGQSGIYRARIQAEGRDGRFTHHDPHVALFGACEQLRLQGAH